MTTSLRNVREQYSTHMFFYRNVTASFRRVASRKGTKPLPLANRAPSIFNHCCSGVSLDGVARARLA